MRGERREERMNEETRERTRGNLLKAKAETERRKRAEAKEAVGEMGDSSFLPSLPASTSLLLYPVLSLFFLALL